MNLAKAQAFLIRKPENIFYMSGLDASEASLLITASSAYLIVDSRYYLMAKKSRIKTLLLEGNFEDFLKKFLAKKKVGSLAFESNFLTYRKVRNLKKYSSLKLIEADDWVESIRQTKTTQETAILTKAAKLADKAMAFVKHSISVGITELQLAKRIECFIRQSGGRSEAFQTIVASGPNSALPHYKSGRRRVCPGDVLLVDLGAKYGNYVSDITRTFLLEPVASQAKELYLTCLEAQKKALAKIETGVKLSEVDSAARLLIEDKYPSKFGHNLGHGLGLEVHESPVIGPKNNSLLAKDTVFTVEPGIYLEGKGGVRIEDMVLSTSNGFKLLTKSPKELGEVTVEL